MDAQQKFYEVLDQGVRLESILLIREVLNSWVTNEIPLDGQNGFNWWLRSRGYKFMFIYNKDSKIYSCIATS